MSQHDHHDADSAHLRAEIRETRERMSETLDQLGTRLNPNRIKEQVRENIREATVGRVENMARHAADRVNDTRDGILDTIRDNPLPAAMIGIGLGWMLFNGRRETRSHGHSHNRQWEELSYYGDISATTPRLQQDDAAGGLGASISHDREVGMVGRVRDSVSSAGSTASHVVGDARERVSEVAGTAAERVSEVVGSAGERVSDAAHQLRHIASDVGHGARHQAYRVEDRFSRTLRDNPLAIGAAAIALGMAAGFAIPESRREAELMGGARDQLMNRVRDVADDARERVRDVAERVVDETRETVRAAVKDETSDLNV